MERVVVKRMETSVRGKTLQLGFLLNAEDARLEKDVSARLPEWRLDDSIGGKRMSRKIKDEQRRYRDMHCDG
jgi:hypothetical protein